MSTESELLIKIRTALEAGGLDAAKNKLNELTGVTAKGAAVTAASTAESAKNTAEMIKAGKTLNVVKAASEGNIGAVIKLTAETNALTGSLAKAIPVVGSFWAGWEAGKKIGDWLWTRIVDGVKNVGEKAIKTKEELKKLDEVKLSALKAEIESIVNRLERTLKALNDIEDMTKAELAAEAEKNIAAIEADPSKTDPQKQREIAEIRAKVAKEEFDATDEASNRREGSLREAKEETDLRIKTAKAEIAAAEEKERIAASRSAALPSSNEAMQALKEARNASVSARETFGAALPGLEQKSAELQNSIDKEESIQKIAKINLSTSEYRKKGTLFTAFAAEQAIAEKQAAAQAEADRKARMEADKAELESLRGQAVDVQGQLGDARLSHVQARAAAQSSGNVSTGRRYNPRSFSAAKAQSAGLSAEAEQAFSATEQALFDTLTNITKKMQTLAGQLKNGDR